MSRVTKLLLILSVLASAVGGGCAGSGALDGLSGPESDRYPDWVRVVPAHTDEVAYYVGGSSIASDPAAGVDGAVADALSQVEHDARREFFGAFDRALSDGRSTLPTDERERLRSGGAALYFARIEAELEHGSTFQRFCAGTDADPEDAGPVCETFVLLRLDGERRDPLLAETLNELRKAERHAGRPEAAEIIERMLRALER